MKPAKKILSRFRKLYQSRFIFRCTVLLLTVVLYIVAPGQFEVLSGFECFRRFSVFHLLWILWMIDMVLQLKPSKAYWTIGSQKFLKDTFQPLKNFVKEGDHGLLEFICKSNRDTLLIGMVWLLLTAAIGAVYFLGWIDRNMLLVISVLFYVLDILFVLYWCPFRVWFMKNRCCTTCRIFNWDHVMMCSPLFFIPGVFTWSLCSMALVVFVVWEVTFYLHPERFWEGSNENLQCHNCPDQLCGQRNCKIGFSNIKDLKNDLRGNSDV